MIRECINGVSLTFETAGTSFSPRAVDRGTLAMLSLAEFKQSDKVLDLGCGYGVVGIYAARFVGEQNVIMCDIDEKSIELSQKNAEINGVGGIRAVLSDGFKNIGDRDFSLILSNPPYHSDFSVPKHFIEKGFNRLKIGGEMLMVTKRREWYKNKFAAVFGGVRIVETGGYFVFRAEKRDSRRAEH